MTTQELAEALTNCHNARETLRTATLRHYCESCRKSFHTDDVKSVAGRKFAVSHQIRMASGNLINAVPVELIATSPTEAVPGQGRPSGQCPDCGGPLWCADFHPT